MTPKFSSVMRQVQEVEYIMSPQRYSSFQHDLYYSRKCFKRPELQLTPYRDFAQEGDLLNELFSGGRSYCMGSLTGDNCWYLYTVSPGQPNVKELYAKQNLPHNKVGRYRNEPDQTLEVLMTGLDPEKMKIFYKKNCESASDATKKSGIDKLIPGMQIDDYLFEPCGYSMNGASYTLPGGYMTIHITPESEFSYVSFETNVPQNSYQDLINRVVKLFSPQQFIVTFFSSEKNVTLLTDEDKACNLLSYGDYIIKDLQICCLPGYDLTYALYNRFPS